MSKPKPKDKPFTISKQLVWEAYRRVAANKGAPGVDGQALEEFEADLGNNLYKIWNRMSSGSYFPLPVRAVEIPKPHSPGVRVLGVPTIADRIAQTVAAMFLEPLVEPRFHRDYTALGGSLLGARQPPLLDHARLQPLLDHPPRGERAEHGQNVVVGDAVERRR